MNENIQEVFGQFAVQLADGVQLFDTAEEAAVALSAFENGAANLELATEYASSQGLDGKNAKGKINVVLSFLTWVDAGRPGTSVAPEAVVEEDSTEDVAVATKDSDGDDITF